MASYPDLKDKVVLLTGIGQTGDPTMWGNGAATARVLCQNGAKIFGCDLKIEAAEHTKKRLEAEGRERGREGGREGGEEGGGGKNVVVVDIMAADVTKRSDVQRLVAACMHRHGRIDVLVNNVGRSEPGGPADMSEDVWDAQMDVNLKSVYLCCHEVLPIMESQGKGVVVNVASIAALRYIGKPQVGYAASKSGIIGFTKATAVMYARKGVRMNVVVPGLMHTPLVGMLADKYNHGDLEGMVQKRNAQVPMGKMGDGFDVAMAAVFLMSDSARYITGQKLIVDGAITVATA